MLDEDKGDAWVWERKAGCRLRLWALGGMVQPRWSNITPWAARRPLVAKATQYCADHTRDAQPVCAPCWHLIYSDIAFFFPLKKAMAHFSNKFSRSVLLSNSIFSSSLLFLKNFSLEDSCISFC